MLIRNPLLEQDFSGNFSNNCGKRTTTGRPQSATTYIRIGADFAAIVLTGRFWTYSELSNQQANMGQKCRYSDEHILAAIAFKRTTFAEFMASILENADWRFYYYVDNLLMVIYEHHQSGKYITMSQACRLIPIGHTNTCKKYVEEAEQRGYVKFEADNTDARKIRVIPTAELLAYVRSQVEKSIDEARDMIGQVAAAKQLPQDNHALAEYKGQR